MESTNALSRGIKLAVAISSALLPLAGAQAPVVDGSCDCFKTNNGLVFTNSRVFDFTGFADTAKVGETSKMTNRNTDRDVALTHPYFSSAEFSPFFYVHNWEENGGSVQRQNSRNNVFFRKDPSDPTSTYLTLRTYRNSGYQSTAEIATTDADILTLSMRAYSRTYGDSGACSGLFTYLKNDDDEYAFESDIEHLTRDPANIVRYTRHPETDYTGGEQHSTQTVLPDGADRDFWVDYRMDLTEKSTTWYANNKLQTQIAHTRGIRPSRFNMNLWSSGGSGWEGTMANGKSAYMDIYWLHLVYNTTASAGQRSCRKTCVV